MRSQSTDSACRRATCCSSTTSSATSPAPSRPACRPSSSTCAPSPATWPRSPQGCNFRGIETMTRMTTAELKQANARSLWHPMAHPQAMLDAPPDIIVRGDGSWIWDVDGHRLVDGVGGLWSANLGFGRREIRDAIVEQLDELPFYNIFRGTTHPRAIELSQRVV